MPPLPKDLGELGDLDEPAHSPFWPSSGLIPTEATGSAGSTTISRSSRFLLESVFAIGNRAEQERRLVTVEIEIYEPTASFDILLCQVAQQEGLPAAGFSKQCQVLGPAALGDSYPVGIRLTIHHASAKIERAMVRGSRAPRGVPVPQAGEKFFEQHFHMLSVGVGD